jgi:hypothetical protein
MKIIYLFPIFFILGCSHQIKIEPNNFPEMKYGKKYDNRIEIEKLNIFGELVIKTDLPDNSGINIEKVGENDFLYQNSIRIYGVPKVKGNYYILLDGNFRGGAFGGMTNFKKKYDVIIK